MRSILALTAVAGIAGVASAQTATYMVNVSGDVDPMNPSVTVDVYGSFDPQNVGFAASIITIQLGEAGITSGAGNPLSGITNYNGTINPDSIVDADIFQLPVQFNPTFVYDNPIWLYTLTWETADFTARDVSIDVTGINFDVYTDNFGSSIPYQITPGAGMIHVVPAPASLALLGLGGLVARRRR